MAWITVIFMAVGLAMDALAVSISNGMCYGPMDRKRALLIGLYFGGFQFFMPVLGWLLGQSVRTYIAPIDHWVVFISLGYIGGSMIVEAIRKAKTDDNQCLPFSHGRLILQAVATSIDALAAGISLAFVDLNIFISASIIGLVAFLFSTFGALLGKKLGTLFKKRAEILGGLVLIGIGAKTLVEHLLSPTM